MDNKETNNHEENIETTNIDSNVKKFFNKTRVKGLVQLGFYLLFFTIVILMIKIDQKNLNESLPTNALDKYLSYSNYEASYNITKNDKENNNKTILNVLRYDNKYAIIVNEKDSYYVEENKAYIYDEEKEKFLDSDKNFEKLYQLNPDKLVMLINKGKFINESKVMKTELTKKKYLIDEQTKFYINTYESNNTISEVLIEYETENESYEIVIEYDKIGQVQDFERN